jgi:hypothetical protein
VDAATAARARAVAWQIVVPAGARSWPIASLTHAPIDRIAPYNEKCPPEQALLKG